MKSLNYVYEIYKTNEANNGTDVLNVGFPMFQADVTAGVRKHCPIPLDFSALKKDYEAMNSEERAADNKEFREFVGQHYGELGRAYPDRDAMLAIVNGADNG